MAKLIILTIALFISKALYICSKTQENELVKRSVTLFESKRATLRVEPRAKENNSLNHKNYNFLNCDWFKKTPISH